MVVVGVSRCEVARLRPARPRALTLALSRPAGEGTVVLREGNCCDEKVICSCDEGLPTPVGRIRGFRRSTPDHYLDPLSRWAGEG